MGSSAVFYLVDEEYFLDNEFKVPHTKEYRYFFKSQYRKETTDLSVLSKEKNAVEVFDFIRSRDQWYTIVRLLNNLRGNDEKQLGAYIKKISDRLCNSREEVLGGFLLNNEIKELYKSLKNLGILSGFRGGEFTLNKTEKKLKKKLTSSWEKEVLNNKNSFKDKYGSKLKKPSLERIDWAKGFASYEIDGFIMVLRQLKKLCPFAIKAKKALILSIIY